MDAREHRSRLALAGALAAAVALAGCGGDDSGERETPSAAVIPARVSEELARASDAIAESLEAGDACTAAAQADELRSASLAAVERGRIPAELERPLLRAVDRLTAGIACEPVPTAGDDDEAGDDEEDGGPPGKAKGHDKGKAQGKAKGHDEDEAEDDEDDEDDGTVTTTTEADG